MAKPVDQLTPEDLEAYPVWEYDLGAEDAPGRDETWVRPVAERPVADLSNRVIGATVMLNSGVRLAACLSNIALGNEKATREFLFMSVWHEGAWIDLARYFDVDYAQRGPAAFCRALGLPVDDVFPIRYDISAHAHGFESVVRGMIEAEPKQRLSEEERMARIFEET